ncbi:hypothetical protein [Brucella pituitosa]|uniref:hypothetical protein n=1 Tax=Brucella pituitosa TaxID=571256 RepID=UPI003F4ADE3F
MTKQLSEPKLEAYAMVARRAATAGILTKIGNHSFRGTGITTCLKNGGTIEAERSSASDLD